MEEIFFELDQVDDWPPVAVESLWAERISENRFKLDNIPFFASGVALGDIVSVVQKGDVLTFEDVISTSGNSTFRLKFFEDDRRDEIMNHLVEVGVTWEGLEAHDLIAINIPKGADLTAIQEYLQKMEDDDVLNFEEGCLGNL